MTGITGFGSINVGQTLAAGNKAIVTIYAIGNANMINRCLRPLCGLMTGITFLSNWNMARTNSGCNGTVMTT